MSKAIAHDPIYRGRRFQPEIIELCVRWYLTYRLSYRDLVEMMAERRIVISHSTILRWVQRYVPEFDRRWSRYARGVHSSWRMDETAVSVRGGTRYHRAVDKYGKTVDSLLCADRSELSARNFFTKALKTHHPRWQIRSRRYLNNIVGAPGKVWRFQRVKIPHRQGASHPTGNRALGLWRSYAL